MKKNKNKENQFPKYYFRNVGKNKGVAKFADCLCTKQDNENDDFVRITEKGPRPPWINIERGHWVEVKPEEVVLILGHLP